MKTIMDLLAQADVSKPIRLLIIGGQAMQVYGVMRQTLDMDCLIADADLPLIRDLLVHSGYREIVGTENFARFRHDSPYLMDVDVLLVDRATFEQMHQKSREYTQNEAKLRIPALPHLIALKLHAIKNNPAREARDLADIIELIRQNPAELSGQELESLCAKYGPPAIAEKLKKILQ